MATARPVVAIVQHREHWQAATLHCTRGGRELRFPPFHKFQNLSTIDRSMVQVAKCGAWSIAVHDRSAGSTPVIWRNSLCGTYFFAVIPISACARQPDSTVAYM